MSFFEQLSIIENIINCHPDCHVILGGDFNVDLSRDWTHTALLNSFCAHLNVTPVMRHPSCNIDYTYKFNMSRFDTLDHFILSGTMFDEAVTSASVIHDVDNLSDHEPVMLKLNVHLSYLRHANRVFTPRVSWAIAPPQA
jgi:endonuclease/exonuclease/phosphatase family metal-dependent hydrolase